jgi:acyl dehydratase
MSPRAQTIFTGPAALQAAVGHDLGSTPWVDVTPDQLAHYVEATGDMPDQDHVPELLLVALTNLFMPQLVEVRGVKLGVNYGTGEVRFPAPVALGARIRGRARLIACDDIKGGVQTTIRITIEAEGIDDAGCVVDALSRWLV